MHKRNIKKIIYHEKARVFVTCGSGDDTMIKAWSTMGDLL